MTKTKFAVIIVIVLAISVVFSACSLPYLDLSKDKTITPQTFANATVSLTSTEDANGVLPWPDVADVIIPSVVCVFNYSDETALSLSSTGSGVVLLVSEGDSYIVTNAHVVEKQKAMRVKTYDDQEYVATLVGSDTYTDLAVIMVEDVELSVATFGDSDELRVAEDVMAVGNPGGEEFSSSVTRGCVSALNRELSLSNGYLIKCIQTDAAINPGNSGGPLVNQYGFVVGINSAKIQASGYEGMGFAITTKEMLPIVNSLLTTGTISDRASLGISGIMTTDSYYYANYPTGFMVTNIYSTLTADCGLLMYDIITVFDGYNVASSYNINQALQKHKPGDEVTFTIFRMENTGSAPGYSRVVRGETVELTVVLDDYNNITWATTAE